MTKLKKDMKVCYFVNVGYKERERIQIMVKGDPRSNAMSAGKVPNLGLSAFCDFKFEGFLFPEIKAVAYSISLKM